ncbi:MAG TPA: hypothetical protein VE010_12930 [Thermoanaerobaculia bacterium]|nr:hypothetical protein [Thermoanaerobaculia bacterium]
MTIHEPMTLATDYLLAIAAIVFAVKLWRTDRMWALAFLFTAAGSFLGGTYHGLLHSPALWKAVVMSVGIASFFLLAGSGRALAVVATIKLVAYCSWMIIHDGFEWVIADYGVTLLLVGIAAMLRGDASRWWILGSIGVSVAAALVQRSGLTLHRHFNHNDLYHLIELAALWLLYRGGRVRT